MGYLAAAVRSVVQYVQGSYREFQQVTWPSREAVIRYTILTIIVITVSVLLLTAFDYGLQQLTNRFLLS